MADSTVPITSGAGTNIDTRTESTNSHHRQVVVLGDPALNNNVAAVASQDVGPTDQTSSAILVRLAGSATVGGMDGTTFRPFRMNSDGAIKIYDIAAGTVTANVSGSLTGITNTVAIYFDRGDPGVNISKVYGTSNGTLTVKIDPAGAAFVNAGHTASIFTVSGSTSGGLTSGVTLVAPSANYSFKVFAYSIQTTGLVSTAWKFTNGGESATELWRPLVTAASSTSSPVGANLAVSPPGFIFATGANTTLALKTDNASLVHYSVSYIKETA